MESFSNEELLREETLILRELIVEVREAAAAISPVIWNSKATKRARTLVMNDDAMLAEVTKRIRIRRAREAAIAQAEADEAKARAAGEASCGG